MKKKTKNNTREICRKHNGCWAGKLIFVVVCLVMIAVGAYVAVGLYLEPETTAKREIERLAKDYYEEYYYSSLKEVISPEEFEEVLEANSKTGFAKVALRQLLLFDEEKNMEYRKYFDGYCDTNTTTVTFYPDAPFGERDYHFEYKLSCQFE